MLVVAAVGRVAVAFSTRGVGFDINAYNRVLDALRDHPLELYSLVNFPDAPYWPYPGGFLPWIVVSGWLHDLTGLRFDGFVQLAPIAADLVLAWAVQAYLGQRGASDRTRLIAAGLVALSVSFAAVSGFHGQLDSLAVLFPVLGLWYWERAADYEHRAIVAGLLIGVGGAIKFPPLVIIFALLPTARSMRERAVVAGIAGAVVLLSLAPFLAADFGGTLDGIRANKGLPGFGGISLLVQPELSALWLDTKSGVELSDFSEWLFDATAYIVPLVVLATAAFAYHRRLPAVEAAVLLYLAVYAFGINFGLSYLVAGLAVFLLGGRIWQVAALQAAVLLPTLMMYIREHRDLPLHNIYTPIILAVWVAFVVWFVVEVRRASDRARMAQ